MDVATASAVEYLLRVRFNSLISAGECHAGFSSSHQYDMHGSARRKDCIGTDRNDCNERKFCAGKQWRNMVYKIVGRAKIVK